MILDTLADAARERTRARQKKISFAKMRHLAESLPQNGRDAFKRHCRPRVFTSLRK